jgi:hypothetical protein
MWIDFHICVIAVYVEYVCKCVYRCRHVCVNRCVHVYVECMYVCIVDYMYEVGYELHSNM